MSNTPTVFNIPAGQPFAQILAQHLFDQADGKPEALSAMTVLLPTRRACRVVQDAFLKLHPEKSGATLLPRLQPIGDLDEEELSLNIMGRAGGAAKLLDLAPAISPIQRQILLAKLIRELPAKHSYEQALKLAQALGHLIDQIHTENLDMADMAELVPAEFAEHWQITLKFLEIISEAWPKILQERGLMDQAERRNALILALAEYWDQHPPQTPVIGAGSTGSIPATWHLLSVISKLPAGYLVLPGFDPGMDQSSWEEMEETHPQFGFRHLFGKVGISREEVKPLQKSLSPSIRTDLAREIMRPAETSAEWMTIKTKGGQRSQIIDSLENLSLIECENEREEAETIALALRETLETPDKTACLVTPDRLLARRVKETCKRWNILLDDSAGETLKETPLGIYLRVLLDCVRNAYTPLDVLAVLSHKYSAFHLENSSKQTDIATLDYALRGLKPATGFDGLLNHIENRERLSEDVAQDATTIIKQLEPYFTEFEELRGETRSFNAWLQALLKLAESLSKPSENAETPLWRGETGQKAARFFSSLFDETQDMAALSFDDFYESLNHFMQLQQLRPAFGTHPRLHILGQLEARLIDADRVILSGLNEGSWPPDAAADPWMSRPMRKEFGLPSPERSIGLAAHDFVQGLSANEVLLTRSMRAAGSPTVPARWLQRLDAVMLAADIPDDALRTHPLKNWVHALDHVQSTTAVTQPKPCPPVETRPRALSVTQIELWLRDPYAIYARHILGLEALEPLEKPFDAAERGTLLHAILESFTIQTRKVLPDDSLKLLDDIARQEISKFRQNTQIWEFWWPRFTKSARWLIDHETRHRETTVNIANESFGHTTLQADTNIFTLRGIVDRIDKTHDGKAIIIDYKSGGQFSQSAMKDGGSPQLPLEALILAQGGFTDVDAMPCASLEYWVFTGPKGGNTTKLATGVDDVVIETKAALLNLINAYDDPAMPYISLPRADKAPRFNDYEHLSRVKEWGIAGDAAEEDAA